MSPLRSAPTQGVRNFAEQIEHAVVGNVNLIASGIDADRTPLGIDKAVYLNDKAELRRFVDIGFDRVRDMLNAMSPEDLGAEGRLFGRIPLPKWQIIEAAFEHGIWPLRGMGRRAADCGLCGLRTNDHCGSATNRGLRTSGRRQRESPTPGR